MKREILVMVAMTAMSACAKKEETPAAPAEPAQNESAPAVEVAEPSGAAAQPVEGDPASAWVELMGVWAPAGGCGDYVKEWRIEAEAFHQHEMHCVIERLELLQNGVRAVAHCTVEGDDDRVEDVFSFVRLPDFTLSIINEANGAETTDLTACDADMIP